MKAKLGKHAAAFLSTLLLMVAVVAMPGEANAASSIGSVNVSGKTTEYTSVSNLVDAVKKLDGKTITIDMYTDWGNERLVTPSSSNATLNMHGHMFNRGLTSYKRNGEVIYLSAHCSTTRSWRR